MIYPKLKIYIEKIKQNADFLKNICDEQGVQIAAITKVVCGNPDIAHEIIGTGITMIGDSRMQNIIRMRNAGIEADMLLVRIPMISELDELVDNVDYCLISEKKTLLEIMNRNGKRKTKFIYMVDVGDLREGIWFEQAHDYIREAFEIAGDRLVGLGTNFGCFGGVIPTVENNERLLEIAKEYDFKIISTGNTSAIPLIENKTLPAAVNHFRLGESIMLGTDVTGSRKVPGTHQDTFILDCEVVEYDIKPSIPLGETGRDAFGGAPKFEDKGLRKRVILAVGGQDINPKGLYPLDERMEVLHASSDHTIVDVTACGRDFEPGDVISFKLSYSALLNAMTSEYVLKEFVV